MKVGIEAQRLLRKHKHGMDLAALHLIEELPKVAPEHDYVVFVRPGDDHELLKRLTGVKIVEVKSLSYVDWEQIWLPRAVTREGIQIMHFTSNTASVNCKVPFILTLHDIIYLEPTPPKSKSLYQGLGAIYRKWNVPLVSRKAKKVVTVSEFELNRISQALPDIKNKLDFIYNAVNDDFSGTASTNTQLIEKLPDHFFFFLGNTDPKKNTINVIRAFVYYRRNLKGTLPLVVGDFSKEFLLDILRQNVATHLLKEIITLGYIDNRDLPFLYKHATGFLYPSLRESFGIPILEAMACGCPVITSNVSSMPEIAGEAAILVSPLDTKRISEAMLQLEKNNNARDEMKFKGLEQVSKFSWRISAKKYASLYGHAA